MIQICSPIHIFYRHHVTHQATLQLQAADLSIFAPFVSLDNEVANKTSDCFVNKLSAEMEISAARPLPANAWSKGLVINSIRLLLSRVDNLCRFP